MADTRFYRTEAVSGAVLIALLSVLGGIVVALLAFVIVVMRGKPMDFTVLDGLVMAAKAAGLFVAIGPGTTRGFSPRLTSVDRAIFCALLLAALAGLMMAAGKLSALSGDPFSFWPEFGGRLALFATSLVAGVVRDPPYRAPDSVNED